MNDNKMICGFFFSVLVMFAAGCTMDVLARHGSEKEQSIAVLLWGLAALVDSTGRAMK